MIDPLNNASLFLINTLFDLYLIVLMARVILVWVHADYFNPLTQVVVKLTKPIISPLNRFIPIYAKIEFSTLIVICILEIVKFTLIGLLTVGFPANFFGIFILACADMIKLLLNTFFYAILVQALLSWIQPGYSPVAQVLAQLTSPIMRPIHRIVPPVGGLDISPIPAMIILQLLIILLANPLTNIGLRMAFG